MIDIKAQMQAETVRQQAEAQQEIADARAALEQLLITGVGDLIAIIDRQLAAEMRLQLIPGDVEDEYRFLYGTRMFPKKP